MTKKLYFNGNVITVNNKEEVVQAVAIEDGKIIKVGTNEEILSLKDNDTEVIDLEGKTMLPGFIDPHGHIVPVAQTLMIVTLGDVTSKEELLARLEESLKNDPPSGDNVYNQHSFWYNESNSKLYRALKNESAQITVWLEV